VLKKLRNVQNRLNRLLKKRKKKNVRQNPKGRRVPQNRLE
jgi:hypothetical protein